MSRKSSGQSEWSTSPTINLTYMRKSQLKFRKQPLDLKVSDRIVIIIRPYLIIPKQFNLYNNVHYSYREKSNSYSLNSTIVYYSSTKHSLDRATSKPQAAKIQLLLRRSTITDSARKQPDGG